MNIRAFRDTDRAAVIALWRAAGLLRPWNDPDADIDRKLLCQADGFLVAEDDDGALLGSVMTGYDGHRGWVNYLAVQPELQRGGIGRALLQASMQWLRGLGCPKLNLQVRHGNPGGALFYQSLGFVQDAVDSYGLRLTEDPPRPHSPATVPRTVVLASRNRGKAAELSALLAPLGWQIEPVTRYSDVEPDETAPSFVENALIKARHAARVSGLPALADDSGLEVAALAGAPGVRSARYAGQPGNDRARDAANNTKLLDALQGLPAADRSARFVAVLVLLGHAEDPCPVIAEAAVTGHILQAPQGSGGFGYDPLFQPDGHTLSMAELPDTVKNRISHRGRAMQALLARLRTQPPAWMR